MIKETAILLMILYSGFALATDQNRQALVDINIGVELNKLEQSAKNIDDSIKLASQALQEMAKNPNISAEQQAKIIETFTSIEELSASFQVTINEIPLAIKKSTPPMLSALDDLFSNIQLTVILILLAILLALICAMVAIYFGILKPTQTMLLKTASRIDTMATTLQTTAEIVDKTTQQQLVILNKHP